MVMTLRGLSADDLAEVVECLILGADAVADSAPPLALCRRDLAHEIGDALDAIPTQAVR